MADISYHPEMHGVALSGNMYCSVSLLFYFILASSICLFSALLTLIILNKLLNVTQTLDVNLKIIVAQLKLAILSIL